MATMGPRISPNLSRIGLGTGGNSMPIGAAKSATNPASPPEHDSEHIRRPKPMPCTWNIFSVSINSEGEFTSATPIWRKNALDAAPPPAKDAVCDAAALRDRSVLPDLISAMPLPKARAFSAKAAKAVASSMPST